MHNDPYFYLDPMIINEFGEQQVSEVKPKKKSEGINCSKCNEFYPWGEGNQSDGTLICWSCRH